MTHIKSCQITHNAYVSCTSFRQITLTLGTLTRTPTPKYEHIYYMNMYIFIAKNEGKLSDQDPICPSEVLFCLLELGLLVLTCEV